MPTVLSLIYTTSYHQSHACIHGHQVHCFVPVKPALHVPMANPRCMHPYHQALASGHLRFIPSLTLIPESISPSSMVFKNLICIILLFLFTSSTVEIAQYSFGIDAANKRKHKRPPQAQSIYRPGVPVMIRLNCAMGKSGHVIRNTCRRIHARADLLNYERLPPRILSTDEFLQVI